MPKIKFTSPVADVIDHPKPSLLTVPEVYKKMSRLIPDSRESTVKACMPFLDAYTIGYTITAPVEFGIELTRNDRQLRIEMVFNTVMPESFYRFFNLSSHLDAQVPEKLRSSYRTIDKVLKIISPWSVETPPGYSCIFTNPLNKNSPFKIIDGVVDTDDYHLVNFPFYWTGDTNKKLTIIEKGTPLVQVIPFKRENWKMSVEKKEISEDKLKMWLSQFLRDSYKKLAWKKKSYR